MRKLIHRIIVLVVISCLIIDPSGVQALASPFYSVSPAGTTHSCFEENALAELLEGFTFPRITHNRHFGWGRLISDIQFLGIDAKTKVILSLASFRRERNGFHWPKHLRRLYKAGVRVTDDLAAFNQVKDRDEGKQWFYIPPPRVTLHESHPDDSGERQMATGIKDLLRNHGISGQIEVGQRMVFKLEENNTYSELYRAPGLSEDQARTLKMLLNRIVAAYQKENEHLPSKLTLQAVSRMSVEYQSRERSFKNNARALIIQSQYYEAVIALSPDSLSALVTYEAFSPDLMTLRRGQFGPRVNTVVQALMEWVHEVMHAVAPGELGDYEESVDLLAFPFVVEAAVKKAGFDLALPFPVAYLGAVFHALNPKNDQPHLSALKKHLDASLFTQHRRTLSVSELHQRTANFVEEYKDSWRKKAVRETRQLMHDLGVKWKKTKWRAQEVQRLVPVRFHDGPPVTREDLANRMVDFVNKYPSRTFKADILVELMGLDMSWKKEVADLLKQLAQGKRIALAPRGYGYTHYQAKNPEPFSQDLPQDFNEKILWTLDQSRVPMSPKLICWWIGYTPWGSIPFNSSIFYSALKALVNAGSLQKLENGWYFRSDRPVDAAILSRILESTKKGDSLEIDSANNGEKRLEHIEEWFRMVSTFSERLQDAADDSEDYRDTAKNIVDEFRKMQKQNKIPPGYELEVRGLIQNYENASNKRQPAFLRKALSYRATQAEAAIEKMKKAGANPVVRFSLKEWTRVVQKWIDGIPSAFTSEQYSVLSRWVEDINEAMHQAIHKVPEPVSNEFHDIADRFGLMERNDVLQIEKSAAYLKDALTQYQKTVREALEQENGEGLNLSTVRNPITVTIVALSLGHLPYIQDPLKPFWYTLGALVIYFVSFRIRSWIKTIPWIRDWLLLRNLGKKASTLMKYSSRPEAAAQAILALVQQSDLAARDPDIVTALRRVVDFYAAQGKPEYKEREALLKTLTEEHALSDTELDLIYPALHISPLLGTRGLMWFRLLRKVDPKGKKFWRAASVWALSGATEGAVVGWFIYRYQQHPVPLILGVLLAGLFLRAWSGVIIRDKRGYFVKGWKVLRYEHGRIPDLLERPQLHQLLIAVAAFSSSLLALKFAPSSAPVVTILIAAAMPLVMNLLYLWTDFPWTARQALSANIIFLALSSTWFYIEPYFIPAGTRYDIIRIIPVTLVSAFVSGIFDDRIGYGGKTIRYTLRRIAEVSLSIVGFIVIDILYSNVVEQFAYMRVLHRLPVTVSVPLELFVLGPLVLDLAVFYVGTVWFVWQDAGLTWLAASAKQKWLAPWNSQAHETAMKAIRHDMADFYILAFLVWAPFLVLAMIFPVPILSYVWLNVGFVSWNLVYARAHRPDFKGIPPRLAASPLVRVPRVVLNRFYAQPWLAAWILTWLYLLYGGSLAGILSEWIRPAQVSQGVLFFLAAGWIYLGWRIFKTRSQEEFSRPGISFKEALWALPLVFLGAGTGFAYGASHPDLHPSSSPVLLQSA